MTRKEAVKIIRPDMVSEDYIGGVYGCPAGTLIYKDRVFFFDTPAEEVSAKLCRTRTDCWLCWEEKLTLAESASLLAAVGESVVRAYMKGKLDGAIQK
jgi:hypothetical protein